MEEEKRIKKDDLFNRVSLGVVNNGIIKLVGRDCWAVITVIASRANEEGECYITQQEISELVCAGRPTVSGYIKKLLNTTTCKGDNILYLHNIQVGMIKKSFYTINQKAMFDSNTFECSIPIHNSVGINENNTAYTKELKDFKELKITKELKDKSIKELPEVYTPKDVINYFCKQYEDCYLIKYTPNYSRDVNMIKNKIVKNYTHIQVKDALDVLFKEYNTRWHKPQYPRPTIGALCSWLFQASLDISEETKKLKTELGKAVDEAEKYYSEEYQAKIMDYLSRNKD